MDEALERKRTRYLDLFRNAAALVAGITIFINGAEKVPAQFALYFSGQLALTDALPPAFLLLLVVLYGLAWYVSATYEFGLIEKYYADVAPDRPLTSILASIFVPTVLVLMAYYADNIGLFSVVFCAYAFVNVLARSAVRRAILKMVRDAAGSVPQRVNDEFLLFYTKRPFQVLNVLLFAAGITSAWLVYRSDFEPIEYEGLSISQKLAAYGVTCAALLLAESATWIWRWRLYKRTGG